MLIDSYRGLIVYPESVQDGSRRKEGHFLGPSDLKEVSQYQPHVSGPRARRLRAEKIADATRKRANEKGIQPVAADTPNLVERFNGRMGRQEGRRGLPPDLPNVCQ